MKFFYIGIPLVGIFLSFYLGETLTPSRILNMTVPSLCFATLTLVWMYRPKKEYSQGTSGHLGIGLLVWWMAICIILFTVPALIGLYFSKGNVVFMDWVVSIISTIHF